jgi:hypothetical protein
MNMSLHNEIGGYFELETIHGQEYYPNGIALNSARNCLRYLLRVYRINKLHMPAYTCPVVWEAAEAENCEISLYSINEHFMPDREFASDDYILYTNYYGVNTENVRRLSKKYRNLIVDNAQSFYSEIIGLASFNSVRKFFGVSDGAYVFTDKILNEDLETDVSVSRFSHLIIRADTGANAGYQNFQINDDSLRGEPVRKMSLLTHKILRGIDYDIVAKKRFDNFNILHNELRKINELELSEPNDVPMVYPLVIKNDGLRKRLIESKIYVATYWNGQKDENWGSYFQKYLLPLPIDQRYNPEDMKYVIKTIKEDLK